jgi:hypothetical protein
LIDGISRLDVESDGLARQCLDEYLHDSFDYIITISMASSIS